MPKGGPKSQDYMPQDFDPEAEVPMPEPLPEAESPDGPTLESAVEAPAAATPPRHMQMYQSNDAEPDAMDPLESSEAESPEAPSLPVQSSSPYAVPGTASSRPYRSANLVADQGFGAAQGFGAGSGEISPEDDDLIKGIMKAVGGRK